MQGDLFIIKRHASSAIESDRPLTASRKCEHRPPFLRLHRDITVVAESHCEAVISTSPVGVAREDGADLLRCGLTLTRRTVLVLMTKRFDWQRWQVCKEENASGRQHCLREALVGRHVFVFSLCRAKVDLEFSRWILGKQRPGIRINLSGEAYKWMIVVKWVPLTR